jgi:hypothetical protein
MSKLRLKYRSQSPARWIRSPPLPTTSIKIPADVKVTAAIWRGAQAFVDGKECDQRQQDWGRAASNRIDKAHVADPIRLDQQAVIGKYRDRQPVIAGEVKRQRARGELLWPL